MTTPLGKDLRILRVEREERLFDMARNLGFSTGFLSSVENGKKAPPRGFEDRVITEYSLIGECAKRLRHSADQSRVRFAITTQAGIQRETVAMFARSVDTLNSSKLKRIQDILQEEDK